MSESSVRVTNDDENGKISFETSILDRDLKVMLQVNLYCLVVSLKYDLSTSVVNTCEFFQIMEMMVKKAVIEGSKRSEPVLRFRNPAHLQKFFSFELEETACTNKKMVEVIEDIITFSTKTGHPRYFYQFSAG